MGAAGARDHATQISDDGRARQVGLEAEINYHPAILCLLVAIRTLLLLVIVAPDRFDDGVRCSFACFTPLLASAVGIAERLEAEGILEFRLD